MSGDWVNAYVGLPYMPGEFDCWSLVRAVYREQLGVELPDWRWAEPFALSVKLAAFDAALSDVERLELASELDVVEPFAIALIMRGRRPHHVGVATGWGVLHAERGCGARHDPMARFRQTYPSVRWWRWPH